MKHDTSKIIAMLLTVCLASGLFVSVPLSTQAANFGAITDITALNTALASSKDGDTITLGGNITGSVTYTVISGKIITIDGGGYTITAATSGATLVSLTLNGNGTIILKNITLRGGAYNALDSSIGLKVSGNVNVQSIGMVNACGYLCHGTSTGIYNDGTGVVNVTAASGYDGSDDSVGAYNVGSGTVNVTSASGTDCAVGKTNYGVWNSGSGTVNVKTATGSDGGSNVGVYNNGSGVVNVYAATGGNSDGIALYGDDNIYAGHVAGIKNTGTGTVNVNTATAGYAKPGNTTQSTSYGVFNSNAGTVNVTTATAAGASISTGMSGINIHTSEDTAILTLNGGVGLKCILDSITVSSSGSTRIGVLPNTSESGAPGEWFTDSAFTSKFTDDYVTGETTLYSNFIDKTALLAAIASANATAAAATVGINPGQYLPTAFDALTAATGAATAVALDTSTSSAVVVQAVIDMNSATAAFIASVIPDKSAAAAALAVGGDKTAGTPFTINITGAKDVWGSGLTGNIAVTVTDAAYGGLYSDSPLFTGGNASIALTVATAASYSLTIHTTGVTHDNSISFDTVPGAPASIVLAQNMSAPVTNGRQFVQQPKVTLYDHYGNKCSNDRTTIVTAAKADTGNWTLTGRTTAQAVNGTVQFTGLGAVNSTTVSNAMITFTATGLTSTTSSAVTLPFVDQSSAMLTSDSDVMAGLISVIQITNARDTSNITLSNTEKLVTVTDATYSNITLYNGPTAFDSIGSARIYLLVTSAASHSLIVKIEGISTPPAVTLNILPEGPSQLTVSRQPAAPAYAGGQFLTQPKITLYDEYGNLCFNDNSTTVTALKLDNGNWTLTGTKTCTPAAGVVTFTDLGATNSFRVTGARLLFEVSERPATTTSSATVTLPADLSEAGAALAQSGSKTAGTPFTVRITGVKDTAGSTVTGISKNVTVTDSTYNNAVMYCSDTMISGGEAEIPLILTTAAAHTLNISIADISSRPAVSVTVLPSVPSKLSIYRQPAAPSGNGGALAIQPIINVVDRYGNICTTDSASVITVSKADGGSWTFSGTTVSTASNGVAAFDDLAAAYTATITGAQLTFTATGLTSATSAAITLTYTSSTQPSGSSNSNNNNTVPTDTTPAQPTPAQIDTVVTQLANTAATIANQTPAQAQATAINTIQGQTATLQALVSAGMSTQTVVNQLQNVAQAALSTVNNQTVAPMVSGNTSNVTFTQSNVNTILSQMSVLGSTASALNNALAGVGAGVTAAPVFTINAAPPNTTVTQATATLPQALFAGAANNGIERIAVNTGVATIAIAPDAIPVAAGQSVELSAQKVDTAALPEAQKTVVGDAQVFNFTFKIGDTTVSNFSQPVAVTVPYTPKAGEDTGKITVFYLKADGTLENVSGAYDPITRTVRFTTNHFSEYVVKVNKVVFIDVASDFWAKDAIETMAAKGIITGMGGNTFATGSNVTRAQFATMLVNALKLISNGAANPFKDVSSKDWYCNSVLAAVKAGIISGKSADTFAPNENITRQEMAVMLARALQKVKGKAAPASSKSISKFGDSAGIADYAKASVAMVADYSIIGGMPDGTFAPSGLATRAQAAVVINKLFAIK